MFTGRHWFSMRKKRAEGSIQVEKSSFPRESRHCGATMF
jgi:hypothetical protein